MKLHKEARNYSVNSVLQMKLAAGETVAVVIPALNEEETIGNIVSLIRSELMEKISLIDELIVMNGESVDRTETIAKESGATVYGVANGPGGEQPRGKGTALWRSLFYVKSSIVIYIDADIENFTPHFVTALLVPFLENSQTGYVKAYYDRPIVADGVMHSSGGGRVTELLVRPLFSRFFPEAAQLIQPLAGEYGFRTELARQLLFYSGYGVETSVTLDFIEKFGADRVVQVDLGVRVHRNRPLHELSRMSAVILQTFAEIADERGVFQQNRRGNDHYICSDSSGTAVEQLDQVRLPIPCEVI